MQCIKCGNMATKSYSPDMDIKGLGTCEIDMQDVFIAYMMIVQQTPEMAKDFTKGWEIPILTP